MKVKQRSHGKAIQWSKTRSGKNHIARLFWFKRSMAAGAIASGISRVNAIRFAKLSQIEKKIAMANAVIASQDAAVKAYDSIQVKTLLARSG